jgi:hypothetical protein
MADVLRKNQFVAFARRILLTMVVGMELLEEVSSSFAFNNAASEDDSIIFVTLVAFPPITTVLVLEVAVSFPAEELINTLFTFTTGPFKRIVSFLLVKNSLGLDNMFLLFFVGRYIFPSVTFSPSEDVEIVMLLWHL